MEGFNQLKFIAIKVIRIRYIQFIFLKVYDCSRKILEIK